METKKKTVGSLLLTVGRLLVNSQLTKYQQLADCWYREQDILACTVVHIMSDNGMGRYDLLCTPVLIDDNQFHKAGFK